MTRADPVRFVEANGLRFGYLGWGDEGPLVLLFHGFPDTAATWDVVGPRLAAAGFRVIAPYLRGYAPTQIPERDTDLTTLGQDVVALIDAFGAQKAHIVGHDWGAMGVYAAAGIAPERIERMAAVAIPHQAAVRPSLGVLWSIRHILLLKLPGAAGRFARQDYAQIRVLYERWSPTWRYTEADVGPVKKAFAEPGCLDAAVGYYRAISARVPPCMRKPVTVPTLAFAGEDDPGVGVEAYEYAGRHFVGGYEVAAIPGGHFCHRESPDAFVDRLLAFLRPASSR